MKKIIALIVKNADEYYNTHYCYDEFLNEVAGRKVDVYKEGEKFYNFTTQILNQNLEPLFEKDIKNLNEKLSQSLNYAQQAYNKVANADF